MERKCVDIGGQAVMEGVMMKSPKGIGIAVRRPNNKIVVSFQENPQKTENKWKQIPFIRGVINFASMMVMGIKILDKSSNMLGNTEETPSKFEVWLSKTLGKSVDKVVLGIALVLAIVFSVFLFFMIPEGAAMLLRSAGMSRIVVDLCSGLVRILVLMGYMYAISFANDVKRTFMYHGAEHKTVYCYENNQELTPENAQQFSRLHPRCGTSFILIVFTISIVLFTLVGYHGSSYLLRLISRLALMPVVAGVSYEILKGLAHSTGKLAKILRYPGLKLQLLTTKEPTLDMLECAIVAMNVSMHGLPNTKKDAQGYVYLDNYKQSEPGYVFETSEESQNLDNSDINE
ncbi:MAG: DUF1385 domain-containing protein [Eubacteriales bacterium]|nr:DUF1385 domain-containing protein [Eubacteriales bacterium]